MGRDKKGKTSVKIIQFRVYICFCQACAEPIELICKEDLAKFDSKRLALMESRRKHEAMVKRFVVGLYLSYRYFCVPK